MSAKTSLGRFFVVQEIFCCGTLAKAPEYEKLENCREMTGVFSSLVNHFTDWKKDAKTPKQLAPGITYQCEDFLLSSEEDLCLNLNKKILKSVFGNSKKIFKISLCKIC